MKTDKGFKITIYNSETSKKLFETLKKIPDIKKYHGKNIDGEISSDIFQKNSLVCEKLINNEIYSCNIILDKNANLVIPEFDKK